jgi:RNA polymerase sigma-70 factor (ECF subfamily)
MARLVQIRGTDVAETGSTDGEQGLAAILAAERSRLVRFFTSRTGDPAEAEDVVQEIWLRIGQSAVGPVANPVAYLHRIGMNIVVDRLRERQRRARRDYDWNDATGSHAGSEAVDETPSAFRQIESRRRAERLAAAIDALPPGARQVFRRHKLDGASHAQIAAELGISKSAVEKHMAVAMRHLVRACGGGE